MTNARSFKRFAVGLVCAAFLVACGAQAWMRILPGAAMWGLGYAVAVDSQQNAYVYGEQYPDAGNENAVAQAFLTKYSSSGKRLWDVRWTEPHSNKTKYFSTALASSPLDFLRVDSNDNAYLISFLYDDDNSRARITKFAPGGERLWENEYPLDDMGSASTSDPLQTHFDAESNLYLRSLANNQMLSVDPEGNLRWSRTLNDGQDGDGSLAAGAASDVIWTKGEVLLLDQMGRSVQRVSAESLGFEGILNVMLMDTLVVFGITNSSSDDAGARLLQPSPEGYVLDETRSLAYPDTEQVSVARHPGGGFCLMTYNSSEPELHTSYLDDQLNQIWRAPESVTRSGWGISIEMTPYYWYFGAPVRANEMGCYVQFPSENGMTQIVRYNTEGGGVTYTLAPSQFVGNSMDIQGQSLWQTGALVLSVNGEVLAAKAVIHKHVVR